MIGIFVFTLLVVGHGQSGYAGSFALKTVIMLPLVARTTLEMLALVPNNLREASYLGVSKWRIVLGVIRCRAPPVAS